MPFRTLIPPFTLTGWEDTKSRVPFTFQPDFPENFVNSGKQPVFRNNEMAAMLVFQTNLLGVELFSHVNALFCPNKLA